MRRLPTPVLSVCWVLLAWCGSAGAQPDDRVPVYIEDSPAAQELVEQADALQEQGRVTEAAVLLQQVIDGYGAKLMLAGDVGVYRDASRWVVDRLLGDEPLLRVYRQVHEAEAERLLGAAMGGGGLPDAAALESVLGRFALTRAGLRAGLALAAVYLERADAASAQSVLAGLTDHPDLGGDAARYHLLGAAAAALTGDAAARAEHEAALGGGPEAEAAAAFAASLARPEAGGGVAGAVDELIAAEGVLDRALWTAPLRTNQNEGPRAVYGAAAEGDPVLPAADGERLYLNEGDRVTALDRYSGRELWSYASEGPEPTAITPLVARLSSRLVDRRGVLVMGDRVVAVVGQASAWPARADNSGAGTALVCLEASSGAVVWRLAPDEIDPSFLKAFFQGTPLVSGDRVVALLRRSQTSGFQDAFVVAVDAGSGRPVWRRHVSSAVTASRYAATAPPQMALDGSTLFVCDNLAAVSAMTARTGSVRWTRVLVSPDQRTMRGLASGGGESAADVLPPVRVAAGLLTPPLRPGRPMLLLDASTGEALREVALEAGPVSYLLPAGDDVLAVGRGVTLLDGESLRVVWSVAVSGGDGARSMAAVTDGHVVVSGDGRIVFLDRATGRVVREVPTGAGGNLLVLDGQLVVAGASQVRSYMAWEVASAALLAQAAASPTDPAPGLALAYLGLTLQNEEGVVHGVDLAVAALEAATAAEGAPTAGAAAAQAKVFEQVLAFADPGRVASMELRERLFERLAGLTATPAQEVAYHLSLGRLYEDSTRYAEAVEHYQSVLLDDTLASQMHEEHGVVRQAALEAQRRLTQLVTEQGPGLYERYSLIARQRLGELLAAPAVDPQALMALARRYPMAEAAAEATYEAAMVLASQGRGREAAAQLRVAYRRATQPDLLGRIAGGLAELYERQGRPRLALQWLRRVSRQHPTLAAVRGGEPTPIASWIADLRGAETLDRVGPPLRLPLGSPRVLRGRLELPTQQDPLSVPDDVVLLRDGATLSLREGVAFERSWERRDPTGGGELLAITDEQVLLWDAAAGQVTALDTGTGEQAWAPVVAEAVLQTLGDPAQREAARPREQREFIREMINVNAPLVVRGGQVIIDRPPPETGFLVALSEAALVVADRAGGVAGVDRHSGRTLWQKTVPIEAVSGLAADGETLLVWGQHGAGTDAASGVVQMLDVMTGESRLPPIEDAEAPIWAGMAGEDLFAVATAQQVTAHRVTDGGVVWRVEVPGLPLTGQGWSNGELLALSVGGDGLLFLDTATGDRAHRVYRYGLGGPGPTPPRVVDDQWQLLSAAHAVALTIDGQTAWRDAVSTPGSHLTHQLIGDRFVVLIGMAADVVAPELAVPLQVPADDDPPRPDAAGAGTPAGYKVFVLDRQSGVLEAEYALALPLGSLEPARAVFAHNALFVSAGERTLLLPGSPGAGAP